jgi:hypothetical protein
MEDEVIATVSNIPVSLNFFNSLRRRFMEYIGGKLPQKRCKTQSIVQNPRKVTK